MYEHVAGMVATSDLDPGRLELWWGDERFVPTDDPERHSLQALCVAARFDGSVGEPPLLTGTSSSHSNERGSPAGSE